jgi:hypothetical protein
MEEVGLMVSKLWVINIVQMIMAMDKIIVLPTPELLVICTPPLLDFP